MKKSGGSFNMAKVERVRKDGKNGNVRKTKAIFGEILFSQRGTLDRTRGHSFAHGTHMMQIKL